MRKRALLTLRSGKKINMKRSDLHYAIVNEKGPDENHTWQDVLRIQLICKEQKNG